MERLKVLGSMMPFAIDRALPQRRNFAKEKNENNEENGVKKPLAIESLIAVGSLCAKEAHNLWGGQYGDRIAKNVR